MVRGGYTSFYYARYHTRDNLCMFNYNKINAICVS